MSFDPKLQYLFANTENVIWTTAVIDRSGRKRVEGPRSARQPVALHFFPATTSSRIRTAIPATAWPWGHLTAIDLKTGKFAWRIPFGNLSRTGGQGPEGYRQRGAMAARVVTASGLLIIGGQRFRPQAARFRQAAPASCCGRRSCLMPVTPTPITYMAGGKQYVAIAASASHDPQVAQGQRLCGLRLRGLGWRDARLGSEPGLALPPARALAAADLPDAKRAITIRCGVPGAMPVGWQPSPQVLWERELSRLPGPSTNQLLAVFCGLGLFFALIALLPDFKGWREDRGRRGEIKKPGIAGLFFLKAPKTSGRRSATPRWWACCPPRSRWRYLLPRRRPRRQ